LTRAEIERRLHSVEQRVGAVVAPDHAARGQAALAAIGVDLARLSNAELDRLEVLAGTWPEGSTEIPVAAIWAFLGKQS
jgi:hypothetical protein